MTLIKVFTGYIIYPIIIPATMLLLASCGGNEVHEPKALQAPSEDLDLELRFRDSMQLQINDEWVGWPLGKQIGQCLVENSSSITTESKEAIISHGVDEAFQKLSGPHLESLSETWDLCKLKSEGTNLGPIPIKSTTPTGLTIECLIYPDTSIASCLASGYDLGTQFTWTSDVSAITSEKRGFEFLIPEGSTDVDVTLKACIVSNDWDASCEEISITLDSPQVSPRAQPSTLPRSEQIHTPSNKLSEAAPQGFNGRKCTTPSNPRPTFANPVIDETFLGETMPPGLASTGMLKPHGYFFVKHGDDSFGDGAWSGYPRTIPVYAPVTSWLREIRPYTSGAYGKDMPEPPIEYMLILEVSCEVYYKLDHLGPLSDAIVKLGPFPLNESTSLSTPLKIEGGDLVSYWSGVNPGGNVDLGVYNTTIERTFANQERYGDGYHDAWLNEDCPFDYFKQGLRDKYYSLFFDKNAGIMIGNRSCRTSAESDVLGTVQGAWFDPDKWGSVFSISTSMSGLVLATFQEHGETGASFDVKIPTNNATHIEPHKITDKHCYESDLEYNKNLHPMYVDLELLNPTSLLIEYGRGTCTNRMIIDSMSLER